MHMIKGLFQTIAEGNPVSLAQIPEEIRVSVDEQVSVSDRIAGILRSDASEEERFAQLESLFAEVVSGKQTAVMAASITLEGDMLNCVQAWLDAHKSQHRLYRVAIYVLIRLARHSRKWPQSLLLPDLHVDFSADSGLPVMKYEWNGRAVAVKRAMGSRPDESERLDEMFITEALVWRQYKHQHLLPMLGLCTYQEGDADQPNRYAIVSPWMERGNLREFLMSSEPMTVVQRDRILQDVAEALAFLHSHKITHADVKDDNVLVDEHCRLLVSDLGVNYLGHSTLGRLTTMGNIEGTSYWAAPELALVANSNTLRERPGPNVDVYSFAFLCFMVSTGTHISDIWASFYGSVEGESDQDKYLKWKSSLVTYGRPGRPAHDKCRLSPMTDKLWDLIDKCWNRFLQFRPSMEQVVLILQNSTA